MPATTEILANANFILFFEELLSQKSIENKDGNGPSPYLLSFPSTLQFGWSECSDHSENVSQKGVTRQESCLAAEPFLPAASKTMQGTPCH